MARQSKRRDRKVRNLVFACALCGILLTVSTYAWFIGMKTVNVSSFDIEIATTEGLFLSMDGKTWSYTLDVKNATAYTGNTNVWAEKGLKPISTIGEMDSSISRMIMYEKGSLTTTHGGYRLLTSRVDNSAKEQEGYVAFDLFIKNLSGAEYYTENNVLNEEAIYLTTDSSVTVSETGGVANTGIENSVRVAFAQIGRVKGDTAGEKGVKNITDITCSNVEAGTDQVQVTGICRTAQIWEPNDKAHVQNAINWYDTACSPRKETGTDVTLTTSYDRTKDCGTVALDAAIPTYAISRVITIADNVDVYDGKEYNTYEANTASHETYLAAIKDKTGDALTTAKADYKLVAFDYFTDSMKVETGTDRKEFMSLAPNSITKVRVYIYIEGQDIDNYDFASLGKQVSIKFGFTKERFTEDDIDYEGPSTEFVPTSAE